MKILSAGRTSVERAALSVARELGLPTEGRCPINQDYHTAVEHNVSAADGTLVLTWSRTPRFWVPTMYAILCSSKPSMGVAVRDQQYIEATHDWFRRDRIEVLHVTGHVSFSAAKVFLRAVLNDEAGG